MCFFFSSRRRHTRYWRDWSSDVCSSDLDLEAVLAGQHQVEEDQVGLGLVEGGDGLVAGADEHRLEALLTQDDPEHLAERRVVVDDQYPALHALPPPSRHRQSAKDVMSAANSGVAAFSTDVADAVDRPGPPRNNARERRR